MKHTVAACARIAKRLHVHRGARAGTLPAVKLRVVGLLGVLAVAGVVAALSVFHRSGGASAPGDSAFRGNVPPPGIALPAFRLRDQDGRSVRSGSLRGKVVVLTVLESKCKQSCPVIASDIAGAWKLLSSSDRSNAVAVAISSNPIDDTRGSIRTFLERRHAAGVIRYLTGPVPVMRSVWRRLYVLSSLNSGSADVHSAPVRIYNRDLTWVATQGAGVDLSPANLAHDVRVALAQR